MRFNDHTRQSTVKVMTCYRTSGQRSLFLMQQPHVLAVPCEFTCIILHWPWYVHCAQSVNIICSFMSVNLQLALAVECSMQKLPSLFFLCLCCIFHLRLEFYRCQEYGVSGINGTSLCFLWSSRSSIWTEQYENSVHRPWWWQLTIVFGKQVQRYALSQASAILSNNTLSVLRFPTCWYFVFCIL